MLHIFDEQRLGAHYEKTKSHEVRLGNFNHPRTLRSPKKLRRLREISVGDSPNSFRGQAR